MSSLTVDQQRVFRERGILKLDGVIPPSNYEPVRAAVFAHLAETGLRSDGAWDANCIASTDPSLGPRFIRGLRRCKELDLLVQGPVETIVGELLEGRPMSAMGDRPQFLFTLPNAETWVLPSKVWHLDLPRVPDPSTPEPRVPGVQVFTFADRVEPGGGGTLVVAGSHRLLNEGERISSKDVKRRLKVEPYFRALMSDEAGDRVRFIQEAGRVGDVEVQVLELHGEPGDAYFVDMRTFHAPAPNAKLVPRVMVTHRYILESLREAVYADMT